MARVTVGLRGKHTLLNLMGVNREAVVRFINGQHRARKVAFAGAVQLATKLGYQKRTFFKGATAINLDSIPVRF